MTGGTLKKYLQYSRIHDPLSSASPVFWYNEGREMKIVMQQGRCRLILKSTQKKGAAGARIKEEKQFGFREEHVILCRECGNTITTPEYMIAVDGKHLHTFENPAGITYDISCYSSAEGCTVYGEPTPEHTWFEGFSWSFSLCSRCFSHLGWFYENGDEHFFGLIVDRLVDTTTTH